MSSGPNFPENKHKRETIVSVRLNDEERAKLDRVITLLAWRWRDEHYKKQAQQAGKTRSKEKLQKLAEPMKIDYSKALRAGIDTLLEDLEKQFAAYHANLPPGLV